LETGISLFEKMAWLISRVEYFISGYSSFNSTADMVTWGLSTTDQLTSISLSNGAVFDYANLQRLDLGVSATGMMINLPLVKDFSQLPGGGILVPPNPLYLGVVGNGMAAAMQVTAKLYYLNYQLATDEYWELVESRRIISS